MNLRRFKGLVVLVILTCFILACAGPQTVNPYKAIKVTAETVLFESRVLMNKGLMPETEFNKVRGVYDKLKDAQFEVINARKALIAVNTADTQNKLDVAVTKVTDILIELLQMASFYGIDIGGGE